MGRSNKRSAPRARQQMAFHERSSITTRLTIVSEGSKWSWVIEHDGKIYTSGTPPAPGPAVFNELSTANASLVTKAVKASPDPVGTAAQLLNELGLWVAQNPRQQAPQPQMTFPSNLANRRNVGQRHESSYSYAAGRHF
jgi:hypothetical protein